MTLRWLQVKARQGVPQGKCDSKGRANSLAPTGGPNLYLYLHPSPLLVHTSHMSFTHSSIRVNSSNVL